MEVCSDTCSQAAVAVHETEIKRKSSILYVYFRFRYSETFNMQQQVKEVVNCFICWFLSLHRCPILSDEVRWQGCQKHLHVCHPFVYTVNMDGTHAQMYNYITIKYQCQCHTTWKDQHVRKLFPQHTWHKATSIFLICTSSKKHFREMCVLECLKKKKLFFLLEHALFSKITIPKLLICFGATLQ